MYGWWGFDSIRSWLSACQRRVVPLMVRFPRLAATWGYGQTTARAPNGAISPVGGSEAAM